MADIRLSVDKDFIEKLKSETGIDKASELANEALTFYKWAVSEARDGRILLSADKNGGDIKKIVIPTLERAKERSRRYYQAKTDGNDLTESLKKKFDEFIEGIKRNPNMFKDGESNLAELGTYKTNTFKN